MKKKQTIFITGSSKGIGLGLALLFKKKNYQVIINGSNLKRLKTSLKKNKLDAYFHGDITSTKVNKNIFKKIDGKIGKIDTLICCYGESNFKKNNLNFEYSFKKNFFSSINTILNSKNSIKKGGTIICISSICGKEIIDGAPIAYSCAKSALNFFIKSYSRELAKKHISLNSISPGNILFEGSVWDKKINKNRSKTLSYIKKNVPANSFGSVNDIFEVCYMLSENKSKSLTGSDITIDGGQTKSK